MTDMTVSSDRILRALEYTALAASSMQSHVVVQVSDLIVLREVASQDYTDIARATEIGHQISGLEKAMNAFKRGFITSEAGSVEKALNHPFYVMADAEVRRLEQELTRLGELT